VQAGQTLLDLPAGGGYLQAHLPRGVAVTARELTPGFDATTEVLGSSDWDLGTFDHVVCLAALHHIDDQPGFLARLCRHVAPGGTLHLADVGAGSNLVAFLDGFVGGFNETGHQGRYLDADALPVVAGTCAASRVADVACPWEFEDDEQMLDFCNDLFGLRDCPRARLLDALERYVGVDRNGTRTALRWHLTYVDLHPA
jgi:SAM-dependent methyltransferase